MARKVLVFGQDDTADADAYIQFRHWVHNLLTKMGYEVDVCVLKETTANNANLITQESYEFAVMIHPWSYNAGGWIKDLTDGALVPCFVVNHGQAGSFVSTAFGVDRNQTTSDRLCTITDLGELPMNCFTFTDQDTAGKEITPIGWETATPANLVMWKMTSGAATVYNSAEGGSGASLECWLPILLQAAINDGSLSAPPMHAMACMDLDDFPQQESNRPTTALEAAQIAADLRDALMVTTIGVPASKTIGSENQLADVWEPAGVNAILRANQVRNDGPFYPIEHMGSTYWSSVEISANPSGGQTKTAIDTFYRDHVDNMHDHGIWQGWNADGLDSYGYHYFNTNRVDDKGLELATPRTLIVADKDDATAQAGYGWVVARLDGNATARVVGIRDEASNGTVRQKNDFLGINLIDSVSPFDGTDEDLALSSNVDTYTQAIMQSYLTWSVIMDSPLYMHGRNGHDYLNTSVSPPLRIVINKIGLINKYCVDTLRCGHPSEYA